ncbi:hypothetical protein BBK36DRAFT_1134281 [Trichoderma citrinoviride]|uniref:Uncharacterized protein n=1 Tax=Trichoderma citrinoviride TaxID=58853 RepID=A0A2T4BK51_9HYPO|nr:hypothetical protein BBK36DRAFT_1134281 [Trichoderma citrinoviride]PTB69641.1 hypothetical protein BBK36DRAFT_1134281 [Trichoderma citrinoviride]
MEPAKDGLVERQHKGQDEAASKQSPPEDERQLISHPLPPAAAATTTSPPPPPPPPIERAASPSSTISSGYGPTMGMYPAHDEGLPEVVMPDETPQALSRLEAEYKRKYLEGDAAPQTVIPKDVDTTKIAVAGGSPMYEVAPSDGTREDVEGAGTTTGMGAEKRIFGLRKRTFWILGGILLALVVAAAVGGGVGGGLASRKDKGGASPVDEASTTSSAPTSTSPSPSSTTSSTSTSSTSSSTTTSSSSPTPTFLNNQTTSGNTFAFQAFASDKFLGNATAVIDDEGATDLGFEAHSYVWLPALTDCCITFCTNATSRGMVGWLCSQRKQPESSDPFKRVYVWCHQKHEKPNAICIDPKT